MASDSWKRSLAALCLMEFLAMAGMSGFLPFLPLYVERLGVTDHRQAAMVSGILFGLGFLSAALLAPFWGHLGDRWGRKHMAVRAMLGSSLALFFMAWARGVTDLAVLRIVQGALGGFVSSATALAITFTPEEHMGESLGWVQASLTGGLIVGPFFGGILVDGLGFRPLLWASTALMVTGAAVVWVLVPADSPRHQSKSAGVWENIRYVAQRPALRAMAGLQALSQVALMGIQPVLALFVATLLVGGSSPARQTGIVFGITAACAFAGASVLGRWADRRGPVPVLRFCLLGAAVMAVPQALAQGIGLLTLGRAAMGFFIGGLQPVINSLVVREVPSDRRGGLLGVTFSASLFGNAVGPFIGGAVAQWAGLRAAFWLTGALLLLAWMTARQFLHVGTGRGMPARALTGEP